MGKSLNAVKVEPGKEPYICELEDDLLSLQLAVSDDGTPGMIEVISAERGVCLLMNEEGKLMNLRPNRYIPGDYICGTFYVLGETADGEFCDLPDGKCEKYIRHFSKESTYVWW